MKIDTIVTDMDGTLLTNEKTLSPYTLQVMEACIRRGIRIIPCSGRTNVSMRPYVEQMQTGMPYIGSNGAQIINADHSIASQLNLDMDLTRELLAFFKQEGFYTHIYGEEGFYYEKMCLYAANYSRTSGLKGQEVGDLSTFLHVPTPKILCVGEPAEIERMYPIVQERFEGRAVFAISAPHFLEVEPLGATKGEALVRLAEMRGDIVPERTLAFGDSLNDMTLLQFTPNSVAMGNARDELKQAAAWVCGPNTEDGLAHFVEQHVLSAMA